MTYTVTVETTINYNLYVKAASFEEASREAMSVARATTPGKQHPSTIENRLVRATPEKVCNEVESRVIGMFQHD